MEVSPYNIVCVQMRYNEVYFNLQFINKSMYGKINIPLESIEGVALWSINQDRSMNVCKDAVKINEKKKRPNDHRLPP